MNHFVVYHNPETMGYDAKSIEGFSIVTTKPVMGSVGSRIWIVTGRGTPRSYSLVQTFLAESAGPKPVAVGVNQICARTGIRFRPEVPLNALPWFAGFRKRMGNFGLGFQKLTDPRLVQALEQLRETKSAKPASRPRPRESMKTILRGISVRQPYCDQILRGLKRIEYRSRSTNVRERVYLYASFTPGSADAWHDYGRSPGDLPAGVVVGSVEIIGCDRSRDDKETFEWRLARPRRIRPHRKPKNQPQPGIWRPQF
jgi:hypothetical protein